MYHPLKIVISGPVGAGKTTFIESISQTPVISTDEMASEAIGKPLTTVAMDFGSLTIEGVEIFLFGTPGQERFDYMWQVLSEGSLGLILLLAGDRPEDFFKARKIMETITSRLPLPLVIGVTRLDMPKVWAPEDIAAFFQRDPRLVIGLDAREPGSCLAVLASLLEIIVETGRAAQE
jgi:uncharacterized protein